MPSGDVTSCGGMAPSGQGALGLWGTLGLGGKLTAGGLKLSGWLCGICGLGGEEMAPCSRLAFCCCTHCATDDMLSLEGIGEPLLDITDVLVARLKAFLLD